MKTSLVRALAVVGAFLVTGCSVLLATDEPQQCKVDADCEAQPLLRDRVCKSGICIKKAAVPANADAGGCESTEQCINANSGSPAVCPKRGEACVSYTNEICRQMTGRWDENALVIGFLAPFTVKQVDGQQTVVTSQYAKRLRLALETARTEIEEVAPTIYMQDGRVNRNVAVLTCDSQLDPDTARAAFDHLVDVVGVKAMVIASGDDLTEVQQKAKDKKIAIMCADCIGDIPRDVFALPTMPKLASEARLVAHRVATLEEKIKTQNGHQDIHVALLTQEGASARSFVDALQGVLRFNEKTPTENGASHFLAIETGRPNKTAVDHEGVSMQLATFKPDIVVAAMGQDLASYYLPRLEQTQQPYYVLTNMSNELALLKQMVGEDKNEVHKRISGTRPYAYAQTQVDDFALRYAKRVSDPTLKDPDNAFSGYDAFYALMYATLVGAQSPVFDGVEVWRGFERLVGPGPEYFVGQASYQVASGTILASKVRLKGLWSPFDWDIDKREIRNPIIGMYCLEKDAQGNLTLNPNAGPIDNSSGSSITGTYDCK